MKSKTIWCFCVCSILLCLISCESETYPQGKRLYQNYCANCHMDDGVGLAKLIPPLASSDYLGKFRSDIACIIINGQEGKIVVNGVEYDQNMPGQPFSEIQINNIINYINTAWGNDLEPMTIIETKKALSNCEKSDAKLESI